MVRSSMNIQNIVNILTVCFLALCVLNAAEAGDVKIIAADFQRNGADRWSVNVTLKHDDTGWDHYADNWRITDDEGNTIGNRVLYHPHVNEQPFTRNLGGVKVPIGITTVYIDAHDKVHGWTPDRLKVDLSIVTGGHMKFEAE